MPAEQSEQAKGEGGIGRHRHAPTVCRGPAGVDRQVEPDRADHPAQSREHGKDDPGSLPELADVEFPACLEPDDQEEEAHEPAVDPATQIQGHGRLTDVYGQAGLPHAVVGGGVDVRPDQGTRSLPQGGGQRLPSPSAGIDEGRCRAATTP